MKMTPLRWIAAAGALAVLVTLSIAAILPSLAGWPGALVHRRPGRGGAAATRRLAGPAGRRLDLAADRAAASCRLGRRCGACMSTAWRWIVWLLARRPSRPALAGIAPA